MIRRNVILILLSALIVITAMSMLVGCGSSSGSQTGTATVTMSDPPTCGAAASGPFLHVYVTVKDVQISTNPNAGDNDSSWVDLTKNMTPQQVDLLASPSSGCFLANFGTANLPAGTYQQIRLMLTNTPPANNACGSGSANCVVLTASPNNPQPLLLSSETQTGIKIPSGQIAGGQFTIAPGQNKNLDIDFDACSSIVTQGNGQFRLKPVLHAGEVQLTSNITGRLVDQLGNPITSEKAIVALEQRDATGVDRMVLQTTPDANGNFTLCPVANGAYDLVAVAISSSNAAYGPTLIASVSPGTTLGNVTLNITPGANTAPASLVGSPMVSSAPSGTAVDFIISALQQVTIGSNVTPTTVTIPLAEQQSTTATVTTASGADCSSQAWCVDATLVVPAANITVGTLNNGAISYTAASNGAVNYWVDAQGFSTSTNAADCTPQPVQTSAPITVTPGATPTVPPLAFTACQ